MYLLSCLLPDELLTNRLTFSPPLEDLHTHTSPFHFQLFVTVPTTTPPEAYSKHAPIGTGRPRSRILLAQSHKNLSSAALARKSLVHNLLSNPRVNADVIDKYNVLSTLHSMAPATLQSVHRGMQLMIRVSDKEWHGRFNQLRGLSKDGSIGVGVDACCAVEVRLEIFLLAVGRAQMEVWLRNVGVAVAVEQRDRKAWAGVYADAAAFLRTAVGELWG